MIFSRTSFHTTEVDLARIVIPLSFSRSLLSKALSTIFSLSRNAPDCFNNSSTRVVFP